jgi:hypothetical protein
MLGNPCLQKPQHRPDINKSLLNSKHVIYNEHIWTTDRKGNIANIPSILEGLQLTLEQAIMENRINNSMFK